jgi:hypothetical protein
MADEELVNVDGDELDIGDDDIDIDVLSNYLVNDEGENIADILTNVAKHLEVQNKILLKLYTAVNKASAK